MHPKYIIIILIKMRKGRLFVTKYLYRFLLTNSTLYKPCLSLPVYLSLQKDEKSLMFLLFYNKKYITKMKSFFKKIIGFHRILFSSLFCSVKCLEETGKFMTLFLNIIFKLCNPSRFQNLSHGFYGESNPSKTNIITEK